MKESSTARPHLKTRRSIAGFLKSWGSTINTVIMHPRSFTSAANRGSVWYSKSSPKRSSCVATTPSTASIETRAEQRRRAVAVLWLPWAMHETTASTTRSGRFTSKGSPASLWAKAAPSSGSKTNARAFWNLMQAGSFRSTSSALAWLCSTDCSGVVGWQMIKKKSRTGEVEGSGAALSRPPMASSSELGRCPPASLAFPRRHSTTNNSVPNPAGQLRRSPHLAKRVASSSVKS
mmetsp:Transcript_39897/g.89413  ORF Transcript_39897/g.89413 Transcript_39897/m.89413 type:complete len:234 (-) Transcript_39897:364-1065(-)